jgi:hypothetical protein
MHTMPELKQLLKVLTCSSLSMNSFLSPLNCVFGPSICFAALPRSSRIDERQRANTASPINVTGCPRSRALMAVHFPVPWSQLVFYT